MPKNYKNAQKYLNELYIFKNKEGIKSINLEGQELEGSLDLKDFPNLELLTLKNNQISEVDVSNCHKLKHLDLTQNNNLTKLTIYDLNFFERLIADTGTLKKSSLFGGESEWDPDNVGNLNIAPLKILKKKEEEAENTQRTFDLADISIHHACADNYKWAGVIKQRGWTGESFSTNLNSTEFSQVKQDFIQQISKNPSEWEIREELETILWGALVSKNKITLLVHKSVQIKRGNYGSVEVELGKMHYKKGFTEEEWKEIEEILANEKNKFLNSENKNWLEKVISSPWTWIIVVGLLVVLVVKWMRRKIF